MPICYTKRRLKDRFNEHRRSFDKPNVESKPAIVAKQFLPANPNHDVQLIRLKLIHSSHDSIRKAREPLIFTDLAGTLPRNPTV